MKFTNRILPLAVAAVAACLSTTQANAFTVTQTNNTSTLAAALGSSGLSVNSVAITNGAANQFGTYSGFSGSVLNVPNGIVLSSGNVNDIPNTGGVTISSNMGTTGTSEFDAYGPGHITNFSSSNDVAALQVSFHLNSASAVSFSFAFGSVEYPDYVNNFTDAFLAFLDGSAPSNQIVFDSNNVPVQVGSSFSSLLTTADTNTNFSGTHGIVGLLTTTTGVLSAGDHTITFEVGDVNDHVLDSAVFLTGFGTSNGNGNGDGGPVTNPTVPEPSSYALMALGLAGVGFAARRARAKSE